MAAQVVAGADVLLAHTFLTHRRALARVGEARRARELTEAAVMVSREAADQGRERRDPKRPWSGDPVWLAGVLPVLGDDPGSGRLGPADASVARDLYDHAGFLADAGVDLIVVEGPRSPAETVSGVTAGRSMGIETWAIVDSHGISTDPDDLGTPDAILLSARVDTADPPTVAIESFRRRVPGLTGAVLAAEGDPSSLRQTADGWLAAGATLLGIGEGATPGRLAIVRAAIDDHELARGAERETEALSWLEWVARGAAMAPSGSAAWLAERPPPMLTPGWHWTVALPGEIRLMPAERYRLVVSGSFEPALKELALRLEIGGVLVAMSARPVRLPDEVQLLEVQEVGARHWLIARRR